MPASGITSLPTKEIFLLLNLNNFQKQIEFQRWARCWVKGCKRQFCNFPNDPLSSTCWARGAYASSAFIYFDNNSNSNSNSNNNSNKIICTYMLHSSQFIDMWNLISFVNLAWNWVGDKQGKCILWRLVLALAKIGRLDSEFWKDAFILWPYEKYIFYLRMWMYGPKQEFPYPHLLVHWSIGWMSNAKWQ